MLIAITGSNGHLGQLLKDHFQTEHSIIELCRSSITHQYELGEGFTFMNSPDYIFHCAYDFTFPEKGTSNLNLTGVEKIFQSVDPDHTRVVYFSSLSAASSKSEYGKVKRKVEKFILGQSNGVCLRLGVVTTETLNGGFIGKVVNLVRKLSFLPIPMSSSIVIHKTRAGNLIKTLEREIINPSVHLKLRDCIDQESIPLRDFLKQEVKGVHFFPVNLKTIYFGALVIQKLFPKSGIRADSIRSMM